jgi:sugar phosphate isomerase/epimerase
MAALSISELTTYRWSFEEDIARFRDAGFRAVGVWRQKLAEYGEDKGIELLADSGLSVSNLLWCGGFTGSEGRSFRDGIDDAREALQLAAAMKAGVLIVHSGARGGHTHNHARRMLRDALLELLPVAQETGVVLAVKPMHPDAAGGCTFLNELGDALGLVAGIGDPHVKIAYDTYHLGHSPDWRKQLAAAASQVAVVHVGDGLPPADREHVRTRLGEGRVPLAEMLSALRNAGYDGYYDIELVGLGAEPDAYPDLLAHSREAFDRLSTAQV